MSLFQKSVINKYLKSLGKAITDKAFEQYKNTFTAEKIAHIKGDKGGGVSGRIFARPFRESVWDIRWSRMTISTSCARRRTRPTRRRLTARSSKTDRVTAVIELKDTKTKDMGSVTEQAFGYKNSQESCKYVITSNFHKLRFYIDNKVDFEEFDLFELGRDDFELLYLLLKRQHF
jgi:hypothetical protein